MRQDCRGYGRGAAGAPHIQYADFAAWQHEQLSAGRLDGQLEYWRRQLDGPRPTLDVPTDRERPAEKAYRGECAYL